MTEKKSSSVNEEKQKLESKKTFSVKKQSLSVRGKIRLSGYVLTDEDVKHLGDEVINSLISKEIIG